MNAKEISQLLAKEAASVVPYLLPNGKKASGEWKVGSASGESGQSMSVRLTGAKAGVWSDFATGEGGDILDLWMAVRGLSLAEAIDEAKRYLGIRDSLPEREQKAFKRPQKPRCQSPKGQVRDWLKNRGLSDDTIAAFKIGEQLAGDKVYAVFPYLRDGELVNAR
jgi:twinkle protein